MITALMWIVVVWLVFVGIHSIIEPYMFDRPWVTRVFCFGVAIALLVWRYAL